MKYDIKLEEEELNLLLEGLGELPAKRSINLIGKIHQSANEQIQAKRQAEEALMKAKEDLKKIESEKKEDVKKIEKK